MLRIRDIDLPYLSLPAILTHAYTQQRQQMNMDKTERLRDKVRTVYSGAAEKPRLKHPFPVGRRFAESLGYPRDLLRALPRASVDAFCGVSDVAVLADIPVGAAILDLGCGAGLDSLVAAQRVGPTGRVIAVDFSEPMLARARRAVVKVGIDNVEFYRADAEHLPIHDGSIDVALLNGIFNLNPARHAIFRELARVVRPGGGVFGAEIILKEPLPAEIRASDADWFA